MNRSVAPCLASAPRREAIDGQAGSRDAFEIPIRSYPSIRRVDPPHLHVELRQHRQAVRRVDDLDRNAADVPLLVEVSDSTLRYDREVKVSLFVRCGIPEVWVADL